MKSKQIEMVDDIRKMCDELRALIPVYGTLSVTEIVHDVLEDKLKDALQKNEGFK